MQRQRAQARERADTDQGSGVPPPDLHASGAVDRVTEAVPVRELGDQRLGETTVPRGHELQGPLRVSHEHGCADPAVQHRSERCDGRPERFG
ncbi:hypothetical protein BH23ACT8_BH23ACT8_02190 [soil metagenome]